MDQFESGVSDLQRKMSTNLGAQLQAMSTKNAWVTLEALVPKINAKYKKYNATLPPVDANNIPTVKKTMVTHKFVLEFLEDIDHKDLNHYGIFLVKLQPENYMIWLNPSYCRSMLRRDKLKGTKAGLLLREACDCPRHRHDNPD